MNLELPLAPERSQRRFKFIRNLSEFRPKKDSNKQEHANEKGEKREDSTPGCQQPVSWEENWEQGEHPFVTLEGNRASCAICLMDFEEPKRKNDTAGEEQNKEDSSSSLPAGTGPNSNTPAPTAAAQNASDEQSQNQIKLADAGEGAQPLRLLECGHVFHVSSF